MVQFDTGLDLGVYAGAKVLGLDIRGSDGLHTAESGTKVGVQTAIDQPTGQQLEWAAGGVLQPCSSIPRFFFSSC